MCYWQPRSSSWSVASFSSGSESDPPVAFIQFGLLCPGMSLPLSFPHTPHWSWEVGCRGKFGTNPKGECYSQIPQLLWKEQTPTKNTNLHLAVLPLLTSHIHTTMQARFHPSLLWKVKSCRGDLLFHKCFMWQAHEATRPSICSWPQGQWGVFRTQTCPDWERSGLSLGKRNSHPRKIHILSACVIHTP